MTADKLISLYNLAHFKEKEDEIIDLKLKKKYSLPQGGIPQSDMNVEVQDALEKAVTAVQPADLSFSYKEAFAIHITVQNGSSVNPEFLEVGETGIITITPDANYTFPDSVIVLGSNFEYNKNAGTISLYTPSGAIFVFVACVAI